jgi:serine/threonine protein kinase
VVDNLKSGKYGIIKEVKNIFTDESCCLKIINKQKMNSKESQELKTEVEIMKICQHPNIVKLYDIYENHDNKFIVMEYCKEGDLFTYLQSRNFKLSEKDVVKIIKQILSGLFYLHQYGITHRDLKPENILVSSKNGKVLFKITDFGLSKIISPNEFCEEPYGTLCYCAPEVISHKPYNKKADLWSIGIITYLMLIGCLPFNSNSNENEIIHQILNEPTPYPMQQWKKVSFKAKTYVMGLLQKDPNKRMSIKEALENEWLLLGVNKEDEKIVKFKTKSYFGEYCKVDDM